MLFSLTPLGLTGRELSWGESFTLMLTGFLLVVFILAVLSVLTSLLGRVFRSFAPTETRPVAVPLIDDDNTGQEAEALDPAVVAAIGAALAFAFGGRSHRVTRIQRVPGGWAQEGRRDIFSSRRVR